MNNEKIKPKLNGTAETMLQMLLCPCHAQQKSQKQISRCQGRGTDRPSGLRLQQCKKRIPP